MIKPWRLPSVTLRDRSSLPKVPAVYYCVSQGKVLYIGKAKNLRERWGNNYGRGQHHKLLELRRFKDVRLYYWQRPLWRLDHDEAVEIDRFRPALNQRRERRFWWVASIDFVADIFVGLLIGSVIYGLFS